MCYLFYVCDDKAMTMALNTTLVCSLDGFVCKVATDELISYPLVNLLRNTRKVGYLFGLNVVYLNLTSNDICNTITATTWGLLKPVLIPPPTSTKTVTTDNHQRTEVVMQSQDSERIITTGYEQGKKPVKVDDDHEFMLLCMGIEHNADLPSIHKLVDRVFEDIEHDYAFNLVMDEDMQDVFNC